MKTIFTTIDWNSISAITSLLSFIILALTIKEMKTQRLHTYKPVLVISKPKFIITNNEQGIPSYWKDNLDEELEINSIWYSLLLSNIGFGAANEIKINWKPNTNIMKGKIKNINTNNMYKVENSKNGTHYEYNNFGFFINDKDNDYEEEMPFLVNGQSEKIRLPMTIKDFITFYYLGKGKNKVGKRYLEEGILPVEVEILCIDISGKKIIFTYNIKYSIFVDIKNIDQPNANFLYGNFLFIKKRLTNASTL